MRNDNILYVVIPCYKEEAVLPETARRLGDKLRQLISRGVISPQSRALFVNDGSKDRTWEIIQSLHEGDHLFSGVNLSRNRGHQNALLAGLMTAVDCADVTVSMDADLQDDIDAMDRMLEAYHDGCDVVYGVRSSRKTDSFFKRFTAEAFYRLMSGMGVDIVFNHADYRLMSRRAVQGLREFSEVNLFLRGIVPLIGFKSTTVEYERAPRFAGESKYPLKKMLAFAMDGITSFSVKPLKLILSLGIILCLIGVVMLIALLIGGMDRVGFTMCSVWLVGGLQLFALGVIGEYIGKIYGESKHRPRFIIERVINDENYREMER